MNQEFLGTCILITVNEFKSLLMVLLDFSLRPMDSTLQSPNARFSTIFLFISQFQLKKTPKANNIFPQQ